MKLERDIKVPTAFLSCSISTIDYVHPYNFTVPIKSLSLESQKAINCMLNYISYCLTAFSADNIIVHRYMPFMSVSTSTIDRK